MHPLSFIEPFVRKRIGQQLIICLFLCLVTLFAYVQVKDFSFITWDDGDYVTENPVVKEGLTWKGVNWAFVSLHSANWHPLTWLSHMLDSQLFQSQPSGHHLTNVVLHIANTILLFLFLGQVTGAVWPSALVAALFAIHPMHVESVAWVSERKDVLSTLFWFATMCAYARYAKRPSVARYGSVFILFALGLMAKPMLVTLPFVLLLLDYWPLNRLSDARPQGAVHSAPNPRWSGKVLLRLLAEKIPLFVLTIISCMITVKAQHSSGAMKSLLNIPLIFRIENALVSYVRYVLKLFWPFPMAFFYTLAEVPTWQFVGAAILLLISSALILYNARRRPYLAVGWFWYLGTLVPVIGVVQVGNQAMADRYT
ncbi:MAG: glycosyltransferase family 39 protein, partial [Syntrophales bacterium]